MATQYLSQQRFTPEQMEFMAQQELIKISPSIKLSKLEFISGSYGPFMPLKHVDVPLWLAMHLKKAGLCKVITPQWFNSDWLTNALKDERKLEQFTQLPSHYVEISKFFLEWAQDDIDESHVVRSLVLELKDVRSQKLRRGLTSLNPHVVKINNITAMEWNEVRTFYTMAFDSLRKIESA